MHMGGVSAEVTRTKSHLKCIYVVQNILKYRYLEYRYFYRIRLKLNNDHLRRRTLLLCCVVANINIICIVKLNSSDDDDNNNNKLYTSKHEMTNNVEMSFGQLESDGNLRLCAYHYYTFIPIEKNVTWSKLVSGTQFRIEYHEIYRFKVKYFGTTLY